MSSSSIKTDVVLESAPLVEKGTTAGCSSSQNSIPSHFLCPITLDIMKQPLMNRSGQSYERSAIISWVSKHGTCPLTRQPLHLSGLIPNVRLTADIRQWQYDQGLLTSGLFYPQSGLTIDIWDDSVKHQHNFTAGDDGDTYPGSETSSESENNNIALLPPGLFEQHSRDSGNDIALSETMNHDITVHTVSGNGSAISDRRKKGGILGRFLRKVRS